MWLTPLFALGFAALALPLAFHFLRRAPSGRMPFSSTMFLRASPPRFVRRRRLNQIGLLLLRALIVALITLAFMRPLWRSEGDEAALGTAQPRLAVLIDQSASMRREGVWDDVVQLVEEALDAAPTGTLVSLHAFDDVVSDAVPLTVAADSIETAALVRASLDQCRAGWGASDVGGAVSHVADRLRVEVESGRASVATVALVTDVQRGSDVRALDGFDWPEDVRLSLHVVSASEDNASLQPAPTDAERLREDGVWVRVENARSSESDTFTLSWDPVDSDREEETEAETWTPKSVQVPPGESRVVRAPRRPPGAETLRLAGDAVDFDNALVLVREVERTRSMPWLGAGSPAEEDALFFLRGAVEARPTRPLEVTVVSSLDGVSPDAAPVCVVASLSTLTDEAVFRAYVEGGGVLLVVLPPMTREPDAGGVSTLKSLLDAPELTVAEATLDGAYDLLGTPDFTHPRFAPFAAPQYRDFTAIRFWRHRSVEAWGDARVVAPFADGSPWWLERTVGEGSVVVWTSGWTRDESDLARSSKFAALWVGIVDDAPALRAGPAFAAVGEALAWRSPAGSRAVLVRPDGDEVELADGSKVAQGRVASTDVPGVYRLRVGEHVQTTAVHVAASEGRLEPVDAGVFERRGVTMTTTDEVREPVTQAMLDADVERTQKLWRWLLMAAVVAAFIETIWAGRLARRAAAEVAA